MMTFLKRFLLLLLVLLLSDASLNAQDAQSTGTRLEDALELFKSGKEKEAISKVSEIIKENPEEPRAYYLRAKMNENLDHYKEAAEDYTTVLKLEPSASEAYHSRGVCYFNLGEFKKSVEDFDRYVEKNPAQEPHYWQRGISHYYAEMFKEGRKQFEIHQGVNSQDVENAVWHFLCVARDESIEAAKEGLIEIQADTRIPMMKVHELFSGTATAEDVLNQAEKGAGKISEEKLKMQRFYAHLYLGLYYEAYGKTDEAKKHIHLAATKYSVPGYMGNVARVHDRVYQKPDEKQDKSSDQ